MSINSRKFIIEFNNKLENAKNPFLDEADDVEIEETKPSRFLQHLDKTENSFANISAERELKNSPFNKEKPSEEDIKNHRQWNLERTKRLKQELDKRGLRGYIKTKGGYKEVGKSLSDDDEIGEENSFFIPNISREDAIDLGKMFDQDTVLFKDKGARQGCYIYTNTNKGHNIGDEDDYKFYFGQGRYNHSPYEYYTRLPDHPLRISYNPDDKSKEPDAHKGIGNFKKIDKK